MILEQEQLLAKACESLLAARKQQFTRLQFLVLTTPCSTLPKPFLWAKI